MTISEMPLISLERNDTVRIRVFKELWNKDLQKLNEMIVQYNKLTEVGQRIEILKRIWRDKCLIERSYGGSYIAESPAFSPLIHTRLFNELQHEFSLCGIANLHGIVNHDAPLQVSAGDTFSCILANMSPQKIRALASILLSGNAVFIQSELLKLFSESEAGGAEFFRFLAENKITVLSRGNNKLYKVEPHLGGESYVLKLEKRLAGPELPEEILKLGALKDSILPYGAKRQCVIPGQSATFNIVTTPFFTGKDLLSRIVDDRSNDLKRLRDAAAIYEQMAGILLSIQAEHFIFPDMKNSNWLISEDNRLHISDTKSFLSADRDHNTVQIDQVFRITNTKFIHTREFLPPEFDQVFVRKQKPISIDKMHAHLLGLNLYQCMTICDDADVAKLKRNMNNPILNSSNTSRRLKYLIEHLLIEDPTERMSLAEAQKFLHRLAVFPEEAFLNKNEICEQLLADLEKNYQYANYDPHIHQFGMDMQKRLREAFLQGNMDELENIHQKLRDTINQQQKAFEIKNIIAEFKAKAGFFTIGMRKKAQNIENAMALVPLDKRADIMKADCAEGYEVKRALSQHRLFTLFRAKPQEGEMGHEEKAAKSYKRAKNAMSR